MRYDLTPLQGSYITMASGLSNRLRVDAKDERDRAHRLRKQADEADRVADGLESQAGNSYQKAVLAVALDAGAEGVDGSTDFTLFPGTGGGVAALECNLPEPVPVSLAVPVKPPEIVEVPAAEKPVDVLAVPEPVEDDPDQGQPF